MATTREKGEKIMGKAFKCPSCNFSFQDERYERVKWTHTVIGFNARGAYYADRILDIPSDFDLYGGLDLGFYIWNTKQKSSVDGIDYSGGDLGGFGLSAFVGGRYFFNPNMAVNLELGGGSVTSGGRIGVSFVL